ncbi:hypothetical protein LNAOJCKE_0414 [Methylorubrum aminovorans]|uniref:Portal protein n=1 Tax=Methylorubrum aminovorans TaxID=269069 RepID=A0ABQ4U701_9HYPH|nr:hypothetical protein LNAOJCKE_0414 [Methylorubrum aminovorans]GMA79264.1 hypothetical protein GCM10025880_56810 [Methylorubrum aminovorans]
MSKNPLTDERIGVLIDHKISDAISWYSSKLSTERTRVLEYYERKLPKPQHVNGSTWVSAHVFKAVEQMTAQLGDTFSAGSGIISFDALHAQDVEAARIASDYTNYVFFKQNCGRKIIRSTIFNGLTARVGIAKVFWEPNVVEEELEFAQVTAEELQAWESDDNLEFEADVQPDGTFSGRVVTRRDNGQVRVEVVNPEDFAIERQAEELTESTFCVHRSVMTVDEIERLYPKMKGRRDDILSGQDDSGEFAPERLARFGEVSDGIRLRNEHVQDELQEVTVYEAYSRFKREGDLTARLYKVLRCGKVTLDIEPVTELPFVVFTPIPMAGRFYGTNYAKTVIPTQNLHTTMWRAMADHAALTTNPRWFVPTGSLSNPKEFLANRFGGIIEHNPGLKPEAMQQPAMNPMLTTMLQGLDQMNEEITGISAASIGLNKDVLSQQNSSALYEQFTGNGQTRQKQIARNFADDFLVPLFEKIYKLVVQFEDNEKQIEVAGNFIPVDPWRWIDKRTASASVHLGFGEKESRAREIIQFATELKQNGGDAFTGSEGFYNMLSDAMTLKGHRADVARYLPIREPQPPQPSEREMAEVEQIRGQAALFNAQAQAAIGKLTITAETNAAKNSFNTLDLAMKQRNAEAEERRKSAEAQSRIELAHEEMELLKNPPEGTQSRGIISP